VDISHSDMQAFKRCRFKWDLTSPSRRSLRTPGAPATALWLGSVAHEGIAIVSSGQELQPALDKWIHAEMVSMAETYAKQIGTSWGQEEDDRVEESAARARLYTELYLDHYGIPPFGDEFEILVVEQPFKIPMPGTYDDMFYVGTWDMLIRNKLTNAYWLVDHKTFSQTPNPEFIVNLNEQFVGYEWAFARLFPDDVLGGCIYDGIYKGEPTEPQLLKNGAMSKRWIKTTAGLYIKRLVEAGMDPNDPEYADFVERLRSRDKSPENPFFKRIMIPADWGEIRSWERNTSAIFKDMAYIDESDPAIYPNRRWEGCWDCDTKTRQACQAFNGARDESELKDAEELLRFWIKTEPPTLKKVRTLKPGIVSSVDGLVELANE